MPRAPRKEQKRKLICASCRRAKQKCVLPKGAQPSSTPLLEAHACRRCKQRGTVCVLICSENKDNARAQPPLPATTSSSSFPAAAQGKLAVVKRPSTTHASAVIRAADSGGTFALTQQELQKRQVYHSPALITSMTSMLLQEQRFASRLGPRDGGDFYLEALAGYFDARQVDQHLEPIRLFYPSLQSYVSLLDLRRWEPSSLSSRMLLATLLWLALPRLSNAPRMAHYMLRGILRNLVQQALARSHEADSTLAPQVVDLLFCYCPLLLSYGRKPSERASARPPLFGSELLFGCLSLGRFDATQRRFHRIYWGVFMDSDVAPDSIPTGEHLASSDTYPDRLGTLALRHRLGLVRVMREYERKVERCSSFYNEKRPSEALAETLRSLLEAFTTAMCHAREDFMRAVSKVLRSVPAYRHEQQARRCLLVHFEQLTLTFGLNFASYITAVNFRIVRAPFDEKAVESALSQSDSSVGRLASTVARFTTQSFSQSLALTSLASEAGDIAWALPPTECAMILCTATKHLMRQVAGLIYTENRKKPKRLEESITLLTVAGYAALAGVGSRVEDPFVPEGKRNARWEAIQHGDVYVAAGHLAVQAASALKRWRQGFYDKGCVELDVRELMSTPGLFCDDESGLEGKGSAYQYEQRKERLLAQMWAASRGKQD